MGFRFRKSFKIAPGIKLNLSKSGISTTIGGRGASVNIGSKGAYLNTSVAGFSNRSKIGGGGRSSSQSAPTYAAPKTPQPASTRWFSFGVAFAAIGVVSAVSALINPPKVYANSTRDALVAVLCWLVFGAAWWFARKALRTSKQARYEAYVRQQAAEALGAQLRIAEAQAQQLMAEEQAAAAAVRAQEEKEQQRMTVFTPLLEKARALHAEGLLTEEQLADFEASPYSRYPSSQILEFDIDICERRARAEKKRCDDIRAKYDADTAHKLILRQIAPGMSREQLFDSLGETSKIERTLTKAGDRETLIYGSKSSGSYFHLVDGLIVKAVVR